MFVILVTIRHAATRIIFGSSSTVECCAYTAATWVQLLQELPLNGPSLRRNGRNTYAIDNIRDALAKGRFFSGSCPGSENGNSKLTEDDVRNIRARSAAGETGEKISILFGVKRSNISAIINRRTWKHV